MNPLSLKIVADREKELFKECPYCVPICPLFDALLDGLKRDLNGLSLTGIPRGQQNRVALRTDQLMLVCKHCNGTRRVLTDLGEALAALLPKEEKAPDDEIPF